MTDEQREQLLKRLRRQILLNMPGISLTERKRKFIDRLARIALDAVEKERHNFEHPRTLMDELLDISQVFRDLEASGRSIDEEIALTERRLATLREVKEMVLGQ